MKKQGETVRQNGPKLQRAVALAIDQTVVLGTPVGNPSIWKNPSSAPPGYTGGRARANWQVSVGSPITGTTDAVDPTGSTAINQAQAAVAGSTPGLPIHITNNLPYIVPLNEGHSKQAPVGFIEVAIADGIQVCRDAKILEDK